MGVMVLKGQNLKLGGNVRSPGKDSVELNRMPFGTHYYKEYSTFCLLDKKGNFRFSVKSNKEQFVLIRYSGKEVWVLLSPRRPLRVNIDTTTDEIFFFSGKGAPENILLRKLRPKEFYFNAHTDWGKGTNAYMKVSEDSMRTVVFPMVKGSVDSSLAIISGQTFPLPVKHFLSAEIRFYYFTPFAELAWSGWHAFHHHIFGFFHIIDTALAVYGIPSKKDIDGGIPSVFDYMSGGYFSLNSVKANFGYGYDKNKPYAEQEFQRIYRYSRKDYQHALDTLGYAYADLIAAEQFLPPYALEKWLAANVQFWSDYGDLLTAALSLRALVIRFPNDVYIKPLSQKVAELQQLKDAHQGNANIRFREDSRNIHSIEQLVLPYKGKVVFLDFWGTWCGYCMDEIQHYSNVLREQYKGKDVVFLYVAFDDDSDKEKWKNDIYLYDMAGEHVRIPKKNKSQMDSIRTPLDGGEKEKRADDYPTYYIFDREGNPVIKNANQPSSGHLLYRQLDSVLELPYKVDLHNWEENIGYDDVHIRRDYRSISSLTNLLAPYRGKTVYLDLWGTWCAPCMNEMSFVRSLCARFKDKDVVFLYVDKDEEAEDEKWRDLIDRKNIEGEHFRMTSEQIRLLWNQLQITGERYPSYFIFDSHGKLVVKNARRPSDGEALYEQINEALNK
jgi:thiol-disulfide isomerase/thioredoxin